MDALKMADVVMVHELHIQGLKIHQIVETVRQYLDIHLSQPEMKNNIVSSREFVLKVGMLMIITNYVVKAFIIERLQEMIDRSIVKREYQFVKKKNFTIKVLPGFQMMLNESKKMSSEL